HHRTRERTAAGFVHSTHDGIARQRFLEACEAAPGGRHGLLGGLLGDFLLRQARGLSRPATQVEEFRAAHLRMAHQLDFGDRGSMERERALDADAFAHLPHRDRLARAAAAHVDDVAAELLLALLVTFDDAYRNLDVIAGG